MVVDCLIYHPTLTKVINFLESSAHREKSLRLFAYLSRFLSYYCYKKGYPKATVDLWNGLKQHLSLIRKAMRFLKPLSHLQTASKTYDNKLLDPFVQTTSILRSLFYAGYLTFDGLILLKMLGIIDKKKYPNMAKNASKFWLLGLAAGILNSLRIIQCYRNTTADEDEKKQANAAKLHQARRKLVWDLLDAFVAANTLGVLHFTEGDIGFAGVITSILGLQDMWRATK
ncbi:PEX11 [[Candida] subhashii]|uniref:PEX11 n=1 Tax=[Candida] subhashii TaxID=561895 RepID=A0A8J5QTP3_9ASCO|nr:PEX11 [[Candida] subhashii]KAG7666068.1 PEX11 [[Candida] subhashii]